MDGAFFNGGTPPSGLPAWVFPARTAVELTGRRWTLLALTKEGCRRLREAGKPCRCATLLLPEDQGDVLQGLAEAERVVSVGLDCRASLTFSSLQNGAVLCVQRTLIRPDGGAVEPQELPLPPLDAPPETALLIWGLKLLGPSFF